MIDVYTFIDEVIAEPMYIKAYQCMVYELPLEVVIRNHDQVIAKPTVQKHLEVIIHKDLNYYLEVLIYEDTYIK